MNYREEKPFKIKIKGVNHGDAQYIKELEVEASQAKEEGYKILMLTEGSIYYTKNKNSNYFATYAPELSYDGKETLELDDNEKITGINYYYEHRQLGNFCSQHNIPSFGIQDKIPQNIVKQLQNSDKLLLSTRDAYMIDSAEEKINKFKADNAGHPVKVFIISGGFHSRSITHGLSKVYEANNIEYENCALPQNIDKLVNHNRDLEGWFNNNHSSKIKLIEKGLNDYLQSYYNLPYFATGNTALLDPDFDKNTKKLPQSVKDFTREYYNSSPVENERTLTGITERCATPTHWDAKDSEEAESHFINKLNNPGYGPSVLETYLKQSSKSDKTSTASKQTSSDSSSSKRQKIEK